MTEYFYGKHTVREIIAAAPERVEALYLSMSAEPEFRKLTTGKNIKIEPLPTSNFFKDMQGAVHQGVVARVNIDGLVREYKETMDALEVGPGTALVLLNEISDPHNVGAIIRSAAAFGIAAVLIPKDRQATITGTVAKSSAGMVFRVPLVSIVNENQTILDLKKRGFWSYGLAGGEAKSLYAETFDAPAVFVVGSEGEGMRAKTKEHCDFLLSIPMHPSCESLNASVATAVALSHWSRQHPGALQ